MDDPIETKKDNARRLVRVAVDPWIIKRMVIVGSESHTKCLVGLPEGSEWIGEYFDNESFRVYFIFRHESFPETNPGASLPLFHIEYREIHE